MTTRTTAIGFAAAALWFAACGDPAALKAAGEPCVSSAECGPGLLCDLALATPVCAGMGSAVDAAIDTVDIDTAAIDGPDIDGPPGIDARPIDAPPIDGPPIDGPPIDAAIDAAVDAPPDIDAADPIDAPPDA